MPTSRPTRSGASRPKPARRKSAAPSDTPPGDRIAVGIVRKPHGVRGEASVEPWTDSTDRFAELEHVWLVAPDEKTIRAARVEASRTHAGRALVKFAGFDSPESLGAIRDWTIEIAAEEARALDDDEYFLHDLIGLHLVDAEGRDRGEIVDVSEGGGGLLFDVKRSDGGHFDLPFAASICTNIDIAAKRMMVELPEGIDELDRVDSVEDEAKRQPRTAHRAPHDVTAASSVEDEDARDDADRR